MKVAIFSESAHDEEALRVILDGVLQIKTEAEAHNLESNGWHNVIKRLPTAIRKLHYQTETAGLLVVVDADRSSLKMGEAGNRREVLKTIVKATLASLGPVAQKPALKVAIGVAMPALEAWLLSPDDVTLCEANWERALSSEIDTDIGKRLKRQLFGVERPDSFVRRDLVLKAAHRCIPHLSVLRDRFPNGFGKMVEDILAWRRIG
jgi:hypothetical protein